MPYAAEAQGKSFSERSALMAATWRDLPSEKKEDYKRQADSIQEAPLDSMNPREKKKAVMRIAKRHQEDVRYPAQLTTAIDIHVKVIKCSVSLSD